MELLDRLLCDLFIKPYEYVQVDTNHTMILFIDFNMFLLFIKHITNSSISTPLSKSIYVEWYIGIQYVVENVQHNCNIKEIIKNFSHDEMEIARQKYNELFISTKNIKSGIIFPNSDIDKMSAQFKLEITQNNEFIDDDYDMGCDNIWDGVQHDPNYDFEDDLVYSESENGDNNMDDL